MSSVSSSALCGRCLALFLTVIVPTAVSAQNLVVNGSFNGDLSGWDEENSNEVISNYSTQNRSGPATSGSFRATQKQGGALLTYYDIGAQCIPLDPAIAHDVSAWMKLRPDNSETGGAYLFVTPLLPGQACPTPAQDSHFGYTRWRDGLNWRLEFEGQSPDLWAHDTRRIPAGYGMLHISMTVFKLGEFGSTTQFGAYFDDIEVTPVLADLAAAIQPEVPGVRPGQPLRLDLILSNSGSTAVSPGLQVTHGNKLTLISHACPGSVVDTGTMLNWTGMGDIGVNSTRTCSVQVMLKRGTAGTVTLSGAAGCQTCDGDPSDNFPTAQLQAIASPDGSAGLTTTAFPAVGGTVSAQLTLANNGTASGNFQVSFGWTELDPHLLVTLPLVSNSCPQLVPSNTYYSGELTVAAGASKTCTMVFEWPSTLESDHRATFEIGHTNDLFPDDNTATAISRLARLRVNRVYDGTDRTPGDGICDSSSTGELSCTLRAAVMEANALPGKQLVELPYSQLVYQLTLTTGDSDSTRGDIDVTGPLTIRGEPSPQGLRPLVATALPFASRDRVFDSSSSFTLEHVDLSGQNQALGEDGGLIRHVNGSLLLRDTTLRNGRSFGRGGAVFAADKLTLQRVQIFDSTAPQGGAVAFDADGNPFLAIEDSRFSGNGSTSTLGGALWANRGLVSVHRSTFDDNHGLQGGAVHLAAGNLFAGVFNSTFSGNVAELEGGAFWTASPLSLGHVTVADNAAAPADSSAGLGGGVYVAPGGTASSRDSIFAGNSAQLRGNPPLVYPHAAVCWGEIESAGYNSVQVVLTDQLCSFPAATGDALGVWPQLAPLADNGGPTPTRILVADGDEIDLGSPDCPVAETSAVDQRGAPRPTDGDGDGTTRCDKGAVERVDHARVTVTLSGDGSGSVTSTPAGIDCGNICSASFAADTVVTLTASALPGSTFVGWTGPCTGTGACEFEPDGEALVHAGFAAASGHALVVSVTDKGGGGRVTSVPSGIDCPGACTSAYSDGTEVNLTAAAAPGTLFLGFVGGGCSGSANTCMATMNDSRYVEALFDAERSTLQAVVSGAGAGRVLSSPVGIDCPGVCEYDFPAEAAVVLTTQTAVGSQFGGWSGGCSGSGTCELDMDQGPFEVGARFDLNADGVFRDGFE